MKTEIKIDLSLVNARPPLRALGDAILRLSEGEIRICRCAVFGISGQPAWASLPRLPVEKDGKRYYVLLIDLPRDLKKRVLEGLLIEYEKKTNAN